MLEVVLVPLLAFGIAAGSFGVLSWVLLRQYSRFSEVQVLRSHGLDVRALNGGWATVVDGRPVRLQVRYVNPERTAVSELVATCRVVAGELPSFVVYAIHGERLAKHGIASEPVSRALEALYPVRQPRRSALIGQRHPAQHDDGDDLAEARPCVARQRALGA